MTAIELIAEKHAQVKKTLSMSSDGQEHGQLMAAAISYAQIPLLRTTYKADKADVEITEMMATSWPWDEEKWQPSESEVSNLAMAAAFIIAEIERRHRLAEEQKETLQS